jgi:hypothetical protein
MSCQAQLRELRRDWPTGVLGKGYSLGERGFAGLGGDEAMVSGRNSGVWQTLTNHV